MAAKPTIQIQVDDSAFKRFQADVQKFTSTITLPSGAGPASPGAAPGMGGGTPGYPNLPPEHATNNVFLFGGGATNQSATNSPSMFKPLLEAALEPAKKLQSVFSSITSTIKEATSYLFRWTGIAGLFSLGIGSLGLVFSLCRCCIAGQTVFPC